MEVLPLGQSYWDFMPSEIQDYICRLRHQSEFSSALEDIKVCRTMHEGVPDTVRLNPSLSVGLKPKPYPDIQPLVFQDKRICLMEANYAYYGVEYEGVRGQGVKWNYEEGDKPILTNIYFQSWKLDKKSNNWCKEYQGVIEDLGRILQDDGKHYKELDVYNDELPYRTMNYKIAGVNQGPLYKGCLSVHYIGSYTVKG